MKTIYLVNRTARTGAAVLVALILTTGCIPFRSGINPIDPPGNTMLPSPVVKSQSPTLSWEPYKEEGIADLSYQLIISKYSASGYVAAYEKGGIYETLHKVGVLLEPHTRYYWRVRPVYRKDGRDFAGSWNGFSYFFFVPPVIGFFGGNTYSFDVE
ncbi:MAG: hypothetical protein Q7T53_05075 [Deltaproteobacteria bacterium]|nr:hypothetical protein [Deltaproteobacteria bacterium]